MAGSRDSGSGAAGQRGRRDRGDGSIYQDAKGRWTAQLCISQHPRRYRRAVAPRAENTRQAALKLLDRLKREAANGRDAQGGRQPLTAWLEEYLNDVVRVRAKAPATQDDYQYLCEYVILPELGRAPIATLTERQLLSWREARLAEYAPSVVKRACQLLSRALLEAYERGALPRNPARNLADFSAPTTHSPPLSAADTQALAAAAPHYHSGIAILCAVRLGLRVGEALGLQWRDYDPIRRTLTIERQITARRAVAPPKYGSARVLPVPPGLAALLDERRPDVAAPFAHLCTADDSDLPIRYDNARRALRTVLRAAGLSATVTTWHGLRHTLGARLTELGANEATIAAVLGHRGKSVTARYSHADVEAMRRWIDAAEGMEEARQQQKVGS